MHSLRLFLELRYYKHSIIPCITVLHWSLSRIIFQCIQNIQEKCDTIILL